MCEFAYTHYERFLNHLKDYQTSAFVCDHCNKKFCRKPHLKGHVCQQKSEKLQTVNCEIKSASYVFSDKVFKCGEENNLDIWSFLISLKIKVENELLYQLNTKKMIKYFFTMESHVTNSLQHENAEVSTLYLDTNLIYIFSKSEISKCVDKTFSEILQQFLQMKTEWTLKKILSLTVCTIQYIVS